LNQETNVQKNNFAENILTLRRRLKLTQREFISDYLIDEHGVALISVSTLSGVENGTQSNIAPLITSIAAKLKADANVFTMDPDSFAKNIELFFKVFEDKPDMASQSPRNSNTVDALVQALSNYLMDAIISGELKPGDKLPSDRALSAEYGAGRSSIREALKVLSALGLITILPGQGTFIAHEHTDFFLAPLNWTLFIGRNNINHLLEMRRMLEVETAGLAAERADRISLEELKERYAGMQAAYKAKDFRLFLDSDLNFHLSIARCSGNPIYYRLLQTSRKVLSHISGSGMMTVEELDEIANEHSDIYTAIRKKDPQDARLKMQAHLERAETRYRL
jgi:DNA-binding FadR family transcriptional regulator